jgi:hypothetical protein
LGENSRTGLSAISPDGSGEILSLAFEKDFGLLMGLVGKSATELAAFADQHATVTMQLET